MATERGGAVADATSVAGPAAGGAGPDLPAVMRAWSRIRRDVRRTPLLHSPWLSGHAGVPTYLKLECWQVTHSFKFRGALNAVMTLGRSAGARGLVTASAGNHGQALALAAARFGASATVFAPAATPGGKQARIRDHGARLVLVPGTYDDAAAAARQFAAERGASFVHAFDDPEVVAGQGTVGLEVVEELPTVRTVVVPVGGGGLAAGVGLAVKGLAGPTARIVGVQSTETPAMHAAFTAGSVVPVRVRPTLCDGLAGETEPASFERVRRVMDAPHLVPEAAVADAIRALHGREGLVAEGSGAVGVAAVLGGLRLEGPAVIVVSGGNIDSATLARVLAGD
jgi:threonine dehydratase